MRSEPSDGFLSRFVGIEYEGPRPPLNENRQPFPVGAVNWFSTLIQQSTLRQGKEPTVVQANPDAQKVLKDFAESCDHKVNGTDDEARRQLWSRAHLNALKTASLLAVADSWGISEPCVSMSHADWAIALILRNIANMTKRQGNRVWDLR